MWRYALEQHCGSTLRSAPPGTYFSIRLPEDILRSLKSTLAVCEFGIGGLSDEHEVGISGVTPDIPAAATLAVAAVLSGRGKQLVFSASLTPASRKQRESKSTDNNN